MSAGTFLHSNENNVLPSQFNQFFKNIQTFYNHPPDLQLQKFSYYHRISFHPK